jgi:hypothetical protein
MGVAKNNLYNDSKNLEIICLLKIVYDLFPDGKYKVADLHAKAEKNMESIMKWRSSVFGDVAPMNPTELSDYIFNERLKCMKSGVISYVGNKGSALNTIEKPREEVERVLEDPWRSLEMDVDGFSRSMRPPGVDYFRDFVIRAKETHGRKEMSIEKFSDVGDMNGCNDYPCSVIVEALYKRGFLEMRGRLNSASSKIPEFAPLSVRLKGELFGEDVSDRIRNSGYVSNKWDGSMPSSYGDIEILREMLKAQTFSNYDFDAGRFYRRGYLEKTNNYLESRKGSLSGYNLNYRLKKDFADAFLRWTV